MNWHRGIVGCVSCWILLCAGAARAETENPQHPFAPAVASFEVGKTTRAAVRAALGDPSRQSARRGESDSWWYSRIRTRRHAGTTHRIEDTICIEFSEDVLAGYHGYSIVLGANAALAGVPLEAVETLRAAEATEEEVENELGIAELTFWERDGSAVWCYDVRHESSTKWSDLTFEQGRLRTVRASSSKRRADPDGRFASRRPPVSAMGRAFMAHEGWLVLMRAVGEFVGDLRLTKEHAEALVKHWSSYTELGLGEQFAKNARDNIGPDGVPRWEALDPALILNLPAYQQWTKERDLDPRQWLRTVVRWLVIGVITEDDFVTRVVDSSHTLVVWRRQLERPGPKLDPKKLANEKQQIEAGLEAIRHARLSFVPWSRPTPNEQELLETTLAGLGEKSEEAIPGAEGRQKKQEQKHVEQVTGAITAMLAEIEAAKLELLRAIRSHDAILDFPEGDLIAHFKNFSIAMDRLRKSERNLNAKVRELGAMGKADFAQWQASIDSLSSEEMKMRAQERYERTVERFKKITEAAGTVRGSQSPVMVILMDHRLFLANDLNADAAKSLAMDRKKLKERTDKLTAAMDQLAQLCEEWKDLVAKRAKAPKRDD